MKAITDPAQLSSPRLKEFYVYWASKQRGSAPPQRRDIDPAEIPHLLPNILIADIEPSPFRVRYRLAGTTIVDTTGQEITGKYLENVLPSPALEIVTAFYKTVCDTKRPHAGRVAWPLPSGIIDEYDFIALPLSDDGKEVDKVMVMECHENLKRNYRL